MAGRHANGTGDATPPPARSRLRRGLVASVLTLAALTLSFEVGLRAADSREKSVADGVNRTNRRWMALIASGVFEEVPDPVRRYAMRPGARAEVDGWTFRVTSHRTRGEDFPARKPAGERRLLCLGDSFAFGLWCDEGETLVGELARRANLAEAERGSGTTWRAVNLGVPGYHSGQQLRALEQDGLALDPDVVVLYFNTNDIVRDGLFLSEELGALYSDHVPWLPVGLRRFLWDKSYVYGWIAKAHTRNYLSLPSPHLDPRVPWSHVRPENQQATAAAIARIAELCRARDVPLFFVHQPLLTWTGDYRRPDWALLPLLRWAEDLRAELALPGVSLLPLFQGYPGGVDRSPEPPDPGFQLERHVADEDVQAFFAGDPSAEMPQDPDFHFLASGYRLIADVVYPAMRAEGMLP